MSKSTAIQKFEALAQQLIEGSFQRFFGGGLTLSEVAAELAKAVEDQAVNDRAPSQYDILLNPTDFEQIRQEETNGMVQLTEYLQNLLQQAGLSFTGQPHITLLADPAVSRLAVQVEVQWERPSDPAVTQIRQQSSIAEALTADIAALDAYLIVEGQRHVPLTKPLISLGRSIDNDIVLDAPTISRQHAQIRWRYGRFVLYDLSSRGRTQVNNLPVGETVLKSGDVISLSSVKLIYGEGDTQARLRPHAGRSLNDETQIRPPKTHDA